jgi:hypothetical protein
MTQRPGKTEDRPTPAEEVRRLYDEAESRTAKAFEEFVNMPSFGEVLARVTENFVAMTRISNEALDATLRNLRLAGRQDLIHVGRQIARTEDKLEMVLQEVERLREELRAVPSIESGGDRGKAQSGRAGLAEDSSPGTPAQQKTTS